MSIRFMHFVKWARVMLPVVFEEFELVSIFLGYFLVNIAGLYPPPSSPLPVSMGLLLGGHKAIFDNL